MDTFVRDRRQFSWLSMQSRYTCTNKIFTAIFRPCILCLVLFARRVCWSIWYWAIFYFYYTWTYQNHVWVNYKWNEIACVKRAKILQAKNIPVNSNSIITLEFSSFSHFLVQRLSLLLSVFTSSSYTAESQHIKQPLKSLLF